MANSAELNVLTVKQLRILSKETNVAGWHEMVKTDLVSNLVAKSRTKAGSEIITKFLAAPVKQVSKPQKKKKTGGDVSPQEPAVNPLLPVHGKPNLLQSGSTRKQDRLILLVRDPFWLHTFWEISPKTLERTKAALGHFWYTSVPLLRLFRLETDGSGSPRRHTQKDILIHGGVNNWYIDVKNPPSRFVVEFGFQTREKKFHSVLSSNEVETPQQQVVDTMDKVDGNWKGVAEDLGRVYKLSTGNSNNQELREVIEEQLGRPITSQLLSRYRASQNGSSPDRTRRHFKFEIDADVIIKGKTDPSVQVSIRNEPVNLKPDGSFALRFAFPDKRHLFPIEAEGSDGVEKQTIVLTIERNTRTLETVIQEPSDDD
ncbi:MAG: DUF4912 domain-containing protein [Planctomycetaceae bacterium]|nr:DUF4912 domain-containing protein [Planctomycetaceae bacterium]